MISADAKEPSAPYIIFDTGSAAEIGLESYIGWEQTVEDTINALVAKEAGRGSVRSNEITYICWQLESRYVEGTRCPKVYSLDFE